MLSARRICASSWHISSKCSQTDAFCKSRQLTGVHSANSDVYLGWTGWAAGGFAGQNYALSEVPTLSNGVWTDTALVTQCIAGEFVG